MTLKEELVKELGPNKKLKKVFGVPLIRKSMNKTEDGMLFITGKFTSDNKDEIGDIITRGATERALDKYRQWGNIRRMHMPDPVGKVVRIGESDGLDWNEVEIKVIDPKAVFEVENGLLQALSVGIFFTWDDFEIDDDGGWIISDYTLAEISLVDHPANYDAKLDLMNMPKEFKLFARRYGIALIAKNLNNREKSPACRQEGESFEDCVDRKTEELIEDEGYDPDEAYAAANEMCSEACSESSVEESMPDELENKLVEEEVVEEEVVEEEVVEEEELEEESEDEKPEEVEADIEVTEESDLLEETEDETSEELSVEDEISTNDETPEDNEIEKTVDEVSEEGVEDEEEETEDKDISDDEVSLTRSEFEEFTVSILQRLEDLAESIKVITEAPTEANVEQDDSNVEEEKDVEDDADLRQTVAELSEKVSGLEEEVEGLKKPSNRKEDVMPFDLEDEETEDKTVDESDEEDSSLKTGVRRYLTRKRGYPVNLK